jgi:hypothetical protein
MIGIAGESTPKKRAPKGPFTYLRLWRRPRLAMIVSFKLKPWPYSKPLGRFKRLAIFAP